MCKSASERGGPYRCSGHAQAALDRATEAHVEATTALADATRQERAADSDMLDASRAMSRAMAKPKSRWSRNGRTLTAKTTVEKMISDGDLSPAARNMAPADAFEQYTEANALDSDDPSVPQFVGQNDPDYATANEAWEEANRRRNAALESRHRAEPAVQAARTRLGGAQADYDATRRGLGELGREMDRAERERDRDMVAILQRRTQIATDRLNAEAAVRRQPGDTTTTTYHPMSTLPSGPAFGALNRAVWDDQITGCTQKISGDNDGSPDAYRVTLSRPADKPGQPPAEAAFVYADEEPPGSCADTLRQVAIRSREAGLYGSFKEWRERMHPDDTDTPNLRRQYANAVGNGTRLVSLLGEAGAKRYADAAW